MNTLLRYASSREAFIALPYPKVDVPDDVEVVRRSQTHLQRCLLCFTDACITLTETHQAVYLQSGYTETGYRLTRLGESLVQALLTYCPIWINERCDRNPYFTVLYQAFMESGLHQCLRELTDPLHSAEIKAALEQMVRQVRSVTCTRRFQSRLTACERGSDKDEQQLHAYISELFERYARLVVIRVDLGYGAAYSPLTGQGVDYQTVNENRVKLLDWLRYPGQFPSYVGYVWKLEYGFEKGLHYHVLFFFNGALSAQDVMIAKMIGDYWVREVTKGKGVYYNCNARKSGYQYCGIGSINYFETQAIQYLQQAAAYLTKKDYRVLCVIPVGARVFGRSGRPKPTGHFLGRPRRKERMEHKR